MEAMGFVKVGSFYKHKYVVQLNVRGELKPTKAVGSHSKRGVGGGTIG